MATIKTIIKTLPEAAALFTRSADATARSALKSYQSSPDQMAANDAELLDNLFMVSALDAKVTFEILRMMQNHASTLANEAKNALEKNDFQRAGRYVQDIQKLALLANALRNSERDDIRKLKEITNVSHKLARQIESLSSSLRDSIRDMIQKIKKAQNQKLKQLKQAAQETQKMAA